MVSASSAGKVGAALSPAGRVLSFLRRLKLHTPGASALLVMVAGTALALIIGVHQAADNQHRVRVACTAALHEFSDQLRARMLVYELAVRSARGAVIGAGGTHLTLQRYREYTASRDPERESPGALGIGFIRRLGPEQADDFVARMRGEGRPEFAIRELAPHDGDHYVIQYIEPVARNGQAAGFDIASEPLRAEAARRSMGTGRAWLTAPISLAQEPRFDGGGLLLMLPVYAPGMPADAPAEVRNAATLGWTYAALQIQDVIDDITLLYPDLGFALHDVSGTQALPVYDGMVGRTAAENAPQQFVQLPMYGRDWRVVATPLASFASNLRLLPALEVALGVWWITVLLAVAVFALRQSMERQRGEDVQQQALARGVVDATPVATVVVDVSGRIVLANEPVAALFGYSAEELTGCSLELLLPARYGEALGQLRAAHDRLPPGVGSRMGLQARHRSGREFPVEVNLSPLQLGQRQLVVAGVVDVTAHEEALARVREREAHWRELANSMPQLVWTCAPNGACDFVSDRCLAYTGLATERLLGFGLMDRIHPEDRDAMMVAWHEAARTQSQFRAECRIQRHDGAYRWFDTQAVPIKDASGNILRWVGANADIDGRRRAETQLQELNATLESRVAERTAELQRARGHMQKTFDAMPSMVAYWDTDLINRFANQAHRDWFGVDPQTLPGTYMKVLLGTDLFTRNQAHIHAVLAGVGQTFERTIRGREAMVRYVPDGDPGEVRGFYAFVNDITDLKRATERAEAASAAKSAFLANMSHEIRTPMNAVINITHLLEDSALAPMQRDLIGRMKVASRSLLGVINDVLDLSKIEAGQIGLATEAFLLAGVLDDTVRLMVAQAADKGIDLIPQLADDLPRYVRGDSLRLGQILSNLLSNAVKFTPQGQVRLVVSRCSGGSGDSGAPSPHRLRFEVIDSGIGIDPEVQPLLFSPFVQADQSTTRRFGGTGLGLAIVRRLVELMGGCVGLDSVPGQGSRFWFELDLPSVEEAMMPVAAPPSVEVLVASDDEPLRGRLCTLARTLGWRSEGVALDGKAVFDRLGDRKLSGRPCDVLLWDASSTTVTAEVLPLLSPYRRAGNALALVAVGEVSPAPELQPELQFDATLARAVRASELFNAVHQALVRCRGTGALAGGAGGRAPATGRRQALLGLRVLVVDDSPINLEVAQRILEREGAKVSLAENGKLAVDRLATAPGDYDVVLMDVQMPVMDGYQATREIRQVLGLKQLPIIAVTAGALLSERERAMGVAMDDFIAKPYDAGHLIACLQAHRVRVAARRGTAVDATPASIPPSTPAPGDSRPVTPDATDLPGLAGTDFTTAAQRLGGDSVLLRRLLEQLLREAEGPAVDAASGAQLAQWAHRLKGAAGNLGVLALHQLLARLETVAVQGQGDTPSGLQAEIQTEIQAECRRLRSGLAMQRAPSAPKAEPCESSNPKTLLPAQSFATWIELLGQQNMGALELFAELAESLQGRMGPERFARLTLAMDELAFADALACIGPEIAAQAVEPSES